MNQKKRTFTKQQKEALYIKAQGKCQLCGVDLPKNWHADHIAPFSKGGKTDVLNGQALCPECNLKKGDKEMNNIELYKWQEDAIDEFLKRQKKDHTLIHATPGGGKTIMALAAYKAVPTFDKLIIIAPTSSLVEQWIDEAAEFDSLNIATEIYPKSHPDYHKYDGFAVTYAAMATRKEHIRLYCINDKCLIIADEIHHLSEKQAWGDSFVIAFEKAKHILGLTGTPWTSTGMKIPYIKYKSDGTADTHFQYGKKEALKDGVCRRVAFSRYDLEKEFFSIVTEEGKIESASFETINNMDNFVEYTKTIEEVAELKEKKKDAQPQEADEIALRIEHLRKEILRPYKNELEKYKKIYRYAVTESIETQLSLFNIGNQVLDDIRDKHKGERNNPAGLIVCNTIKSAKLLRDKIKEETGNTYPLVTSENKSKSLSQIAKFRNSNQKWLISVAMVTEGIDIKRLQVCVYLSTVCTELKLRQIVGRIERPTGKDELSGFLYLHQPEITDIIEIMEKENRGIPLKDKKKRKGGGGGGEQKTKIVFTPNGTPISIAALMYSSKVFDGNILEAAISAQAEKDLPYPDLIFTCVLFNKNGVKPGIELLQTYIDFRKGNPKFSRVPLEAIEEIIKITQGDF